MFDLIAEVSEYSPTGLSLKNLKQLNIKGPIHQSLNIIPGQHLYPYAGLPNANGKKPLYLFPHEINKNQYFLTLEFQNVNSFIELSKDLASSDVNVIASKYLAFSNDHTVSLIYEIQDPCEDWFGNNFINYIINKYGDVKVMKSKSFWYGDRDDQNAKLYANLLKTRRNLTFRIKKVSPNYTITLNKDDFKKIGFNEPAQIKKCVQIAYPDIGAIVLHFFDHIRIKEVYLGYPNIPGSYACTLQLLNELKIENRFNIQKNTRMEQEEGYTTDRFILEYQLEQQSFFLLDGRDYKKLREKLNDIFFLNENERYTDLLNTLNQKYKNKKEFILFISDSPKRVEKLGNKPSQDEMVKESIDLQSCQ